MTALISGRTPWGFTAHGPNGHLTANTTVEDRKHRAELGETALRLLGGLGIGIDVIEKLNELPENTGAAEMVAELEGLLQKPAEPLNDGPAACGSQCPNNDLFCDLQTGHQDGHEGDLGGGERQGWVSP